MRGLRIAVDAHRLVCSPQTSGATYLGALVAEWLTYPNAPELDLLVPFKPELSFSAQPVYAHPKVRLLSPSRAVNPVARFRSQILWQQSVIPGLLRQSRPDVYFSPFHLTPQLPWRIKMVSAIHDLCCLFEPFFSRASLIHRAQLWSACVRATRLICVSEFTYAMLARWSPRWARKAGVVHNGLSGQPLPRAEAEGLLHAACPELVAGEYLLWIGHPTPRKNPELLLAVFQAHHRRYPGHKLVVVAPAAAHSQMRALAQACNVESALRLFSNIDTRTRDAFYRCALALLFPSRCEGFGYPVLEAMLQGCPSFAARRGPAREMLEGILPMAAGLNTEAFTAALDSYLSRPSSEREKLGRLLVERSARFSITAMAAGTMEILERAAGNAGSETNPQNPTN